MRSLQATAAGLAAPSDSAQMVYRSSDAMWDSKAVPGPRLAEVAAVLVAVAGVGSVGAGDLRDPVAPQKDQTTTIMHLGSRTIDSNSSNSSQMGQS